jgi:hypothetical protein
MSDEATPWHESRQAWDRLEAWYRNLSSSAVAPMDKGDGALDALADGGLVRRLLDRAELEAVRSARKHGKSWAEIAVRLGVTRQSAWERWREVDAAASASPAASTPVPGREEWPFEDEDGEDGEDELQRLSYDPGAESPRLSARARGLRRRSKVNVPSVIGMTREAARAALSRIGLVAVSPDSDGAPLEALSDAGDVVTDQSPESGARVPAGSTVMLWTDRRGGSDAREPRRPIPDPKTGRAMRDETAGDIVN